MKRSFDSLSTAAAKELLTAVLAEGNRFRFTVHGVSMCPFIREGDSVELDAVGTVRVGNILLAEKNGRLLLHRAIKVKKDAVLLKGDNLNTADGWFLKEEILAVAVAVTHKGMPQKWGLERFSRTAAVLSRNNLLRKTAVFGSKFLKKVKKNY